MVEQNSSKKKMVEQRSFDKSYQSENCTALHSFHSSGIVSQELWWNDWYDELVQSFKLHADSGQDQPNI
jgi:hypothetical protein